MICDKGSSYLCHFRTRLFLLDMWYINIACQIERFDAPKWGSMGVEKRTQTHMSHTYLSLYYIYIHTYIHTVFICLFKIYVDI